MKRLKNDPALAELPAPVILTPEQLALVATDTAAMLGAGGGIRIICGIPPVVEISVVAASQIATTAAM